MAKRKDSFKKAKSTVAIAKKAKREAEPPPPQLGERTPTRQEETRPPSVIIGSQPDVSLSSCTRYVRCLTRLHRLQQHYCDQKQDFIASYMLTECLVPAAGPSISPFTCSTSPVPDTENQTGGTTDSEPMPVVKCEPHGPAESKASTSTVPAKKAELLECAYCPFKDASSTVMQAHREKHKSYTDPLLCIHCTYKCTCDVASAENPCLRCKYSCTRDLEVRRPGQAKADEEDPKTKVESVACPLAGCQFVGPSELQTAVHLIMQHDYSLSCGCLPDGPPHSWSWHKRDNYFHHLRRKRSERPLGLQYLRLSDVAPISSLQPMPTAGGDRKSAHFTAQAPTTDGC